MKTHAFKSLDLQLNIVRCTCGWQGHASDIVDARAEHGRHLADLRPVQRSTAKGWATPQEGIRKS